MHDVCSSAAAWFGSMRILGAMRRATIGILLVTALVLLGGCQRSLFPSSEPRTQYESYDRMRNRHTPMERPDPFGGNRPALRERLSKTGVR